MLITIIKDNKLLADNLAKKIKKNGFNTRIINNCKDLLENNFSDSDLYIIGYNSSNIKNCDIIKALREKKLSSSPIIVISQKYEIKNLVNYLDLGADEYLSKPLVNEELIARIKALIRRSYKINHKLKIRYKNVIFDIKNRIVTNNGVVINFTPRELQLIEFILLNKGKLITKYELINFVWGEQDLLKISDNTINVTISNIRKKLGKEFKFKTLVNKGYILEN